MPLNEAERRRRIWNTIVLLDVNSSISNGMPTCVRSEDYDCEVSPELRAQGGCDSMFQIRLAEALPIVLSIINRLNSATPDMEYSKVLEYDAAAREVLAKIPERAPVDLPDTQFLILRRTMLDILLRRTLLALHQPYSRDPLCWERYEKSYWAVLECSLALLHHHQNLQDVSLTPSELPLGQSPNSLLWFSDLFKFDFSIANVYVCLALQRKDFCHKLANPSSGPPAERIARNSMHKTVEIFGRNVSRSVNHFRNYMCGMFTLAALEASETGAPQLECFERAANTIIQVVEESRPQSEQVFDEKDAEMT